MELELINPTDLTIGAVLTALNDAQQDGALLSLEFGRSADDSETFGALVWRDVHSSRAFVEAFLKAARALIESGDVTEGALLLALAERRVSSPSV